MGNRGVTHHGGLSVEGSGLWVGAKNSEVAMFPQNLAGVPRIDAGTFGRSGWIYRSVSTRLSSVTLAVATPVWPSEGISQLSSGFISQIGATTSGHCIDFQLMTVVSAPSGVGGCITSGGTSSTVAWFAIGI